MTNDPLVVVRAAGIDDLKAVVDLHMASFPGFFLSRLGPSFLAQYYRLILEFDQGILLIAQAHGITVGFVAGFVDPDDFYRRMSSEKRRFILPALWGVLANPLVLPRLIANVRNVVSRNPVALSRGRACELASIAVSPVAGGKGIGKRLVRDFLTAGSNTADYVYLSTDASRNDGVNAFYHSLGFELSETYIAHGNREMNRYVKRLKECGE